MIKRKLLDELKSHLIKKEISLIIGPRQAGKTTLMLLLKDLLEKKGERTVFLNLDVETDNRFFVSQASLIDKIRLEIGSQPGFVFLDEIQRKENAGLFLKGIYDLNLPYKFIVSGSGSVDLKEKIHESLAGRKRIFELGTISFEEFVNSKTNYRYENRLEDFFQIEKDQTQRLFWEYLNFGGYPRVILEETLEEKEKILGEIYQSYLEKDIAFLGLVKTEAFTHLIKIIASQIGNLTNLSELSSTLGISVQTVKNYLWYAEKTFVLQKTLPYFKNLRKEITKSAIYYFSDLGLRNYTLGLLGKIDPLVGNGFLFQNFVFRLLKENLPPKPVQIKFWRTKDRAEVDFLLDLTRCQIPLEVKFRQIEKAKINKSLKSFIEKYQPQKALVVNLGLKKKAKLGKTEVFFVPYYHLLKKSFYRELLG